MVFGRRFDLRGEVEVLPAFSREAEVDGFAGGGGTNVFAGGESAIEVGSVRYDRCSVGLTVFGDGVMVSFGVGDVGGLGLTFVFRYLANGAFSESTVPSDSSSDEVKPARRHESAAGLLSLSCVRSTAGVCAFFFCRFTTGTSSWFAKFAEFLEFRVGRKFSL